MNTAVSTNRSDYLDRVASGLADLTEEDRTEVIQDLRAHLAELDDDAIETTLGSPEQFVAEFRSSAGLDDQPEKTRRWSLARTRLEARSRKLAELVRWQTWRPLWIWTRGWLVVATYAVLTGGTVFHHFPIPSIDYSTTIGFALVALATWLSVWLDRRQTGLRQAGSFILSSFALILIAASLVAAREVARTYPIEEDVYYDQLVGPEGNQITNIYAYDVDGNPVEVLLFDQEGQPILSLPSWVYEEAANFPGPYDYGGGMVEFPRDDFGRPITNLYPLETLDYSGAPIRPPLFGFPEVGEEANPGTITTTTFLGAID